MTRLQLKLNYKKVIINLNSLKSIYTRYISLSRNASIDIPAVIFLYDNEVIDYYVLQCVVCEGDDTYSVGILAPKCYIATLNVM